MKRAISLVLMLSALLFSTVPLAAQANSDYDRISINQKQLIAAVRVKGYYRKDGTYVRPHYRSNPDGNPYNNWSFPGNVNPYTGKVAPGNPDTYLKNYYKNRSYSSPSYYDTSNTPSTTSILGSSHYGTYNLYRVPYTNTIWELSGYPGYGTGKRRAFTSPEAFEMKYGRDGWKYLKTISADELTRYTTDNSYDYRLYKAQNSNIVWEISGNAGYGTGTRRSFMNPKAFETRYGNGGWKYIKPISPGELERYTILAPYF